MAKKIFMYHGKTTEELKEMSLKEFADIAGSRIRRSLKRGFTDSQKVLLEKIRNKKRNIKTHCRDMVIIPEMIDTTLKVHSGKDFIQVIITPEMVGHYLGEFVLTRKSLKHSAPGVGATKSSASASVR